MLTYVQKSQWLVGGVPSHSGLLAWFRRYVKQLLLIWSPQFRSFGGLVPWLLALAGTSCVGTAVSKTELRGVSESRGRGRLGAGQEEERLAPPARSVFPSRTGAVGRGPAWPGVALPPAAPPS